MHYRPALLAAMAGLALAASAAAQPIQVIFTNLPGHPSNEVPGLPGMPFKAGTSSQFDRPYLSPDGSRWVISAFAATGSTATDEVIITGQGTDRSTFGLVAQEGTTAPFGRVWGPVEQKLAINDAGQIAFVTDLADGAINDDEVLARFSGTTFDSIVLREGDPFPALGPNVFVGATLDSPNLTSAGAVGAYVLLAGPGVTAANDSILALGGAVLAQEGTTVLSTGFAWDNFDTADFAIDATGANFVAKGDDENPTTAMDKVGVLNNTAVLIEGTTIAGLTSPIAASAIDEIFISPSGDWIASGNNTNADEDWVVRNGQLVAAGLQDITPASPSGELFDDTTYADLFFTIAANGAGDYIVGGVTDAADDDANAVLVLNGERVVVREGDPVDLNGDGLDNDNAYVSIFNNFDVALTDDRQLYFMADLRDAAGNALSSQAFLTIDLGASCPADFDNSGDLTLADFVAFRNAYVAGDLAADFDQSGTLTLADFVAFRNAYVAGCP